LKAIVFKRRFFVFILLFYFTNVQAQIRDSLGLNTFSWSNQRQQKVAFSKDTLQLDSLTISKINSFSSRDGQLYPDSCYSKIDNKILLNPNCFNVKDSFTVNYEVIPLSLHRPVFNKNRNMIGKKTLLGEDFVIGSGYSYNPFAQNQDNNDFKGLDYSGSFSRGISVGNRQDLILNSGFNLQLGGKIGDVEISGAISDNNIPLQPEGNTQQLQDFDRIFLQFKLNDNFLLAGDYDLKRPEGSYFANYYRRTQGIQVGSTFKVNQQTTVKTDASFAISRGTFTRNSFLGQEGNQGPYRLKGANGETFLIIIAGTERVFMDGILLSRGADNDYIIDYNLGEIIFTNKRLITKDKRIQIEFSYSDLNYLRTINTFNSSIKQGNTAFRINWYSEQDVKNQPAQANLSDSAKAVLRRVGDNLNEAFVWGASIPDSDQSISGLVKYKLVDTLVATVLYDSVLVYSTNEDSAIYTVKFSQISNGGNYIRINSAANGTVFAWIAPDSVTGAPRGTHEPIELLSTPKMRQMLNVGADYKMGKNGIIQADLALSNNDLNTFSKVSNEDNLGIASRLSYQHKIKIFERSIRSEKDSSKTEKNITNLLLGAHYEFVQNRFEVLEPYRPREFQRDWNTEQIGKTNEHLLNATIGLESSKWGFVKYQFAALLKEDLYQGSKHQLNTDIKFKGWNLLTNASYLKVNSSFEKTSFLRPTVDLSYQFKKIKGFKIGIYGEQEKNERILTGSDTLSAASLYYDVIKFYAELPASEKLGLKASALRRYDYIPVSRQFKTLTIADELNFGGDWKSGKISNLQWNLNYRNLKIVDSSRTNLEPKETYLGRVEYNLNLKKGFIRLNTIYELGAGQQQRLAYNYVEVDRGMGTHIWIDRNEDGIQQQNEFEQAIFMDQANFLRVTLLTNEFIKTNNVSLSQSIDLDPSVFFKKKAKNAPKSNFAFLGKFSSRTLLKIDRKTIANADILAFNPFQFDVADSSLLSTGSTIRNIIYFNRTETKFRVEFQQSDSRVKTLLNIGFETRRRSDFSLLPSFKIGNNFRAQLTAIYGFNDNFSQFFSDRNYELRFWEAQPQLTYMRKTIFRTSLMYKFKDNRNRIGAMENARSHDITVEAKYSKSGKANTSIRSSFSWVNLKFVGQNNTPVQFAMTDGLQNGQNFLWSLSIDRSISKNIQLNIGYEGRKTGTATVVHVGRAQIRAVF
jgi:hypothetical protein